MDRFRPVPVCLILATSSWLVQSTIAVESNLPNVRNEIPLEDFVIQAHRGGGLLRPENTLETFLYAWDLGVVPEADVRTTKDGVIVAFHDKGFKRVVRDASEELRKKRFEDLSFAELRKLDVGGYRGDAFIGERIPTMEDVFAAMQGRPKRQIYLDIKGVSLPELAAMVKKYGVSKQVIFASTHDPLIREWKQLVPDSQSLNWMGGTEKELTERLQRLEKDRFEGITSLQIHVRLKDLDDPKAPFTPSPEFLRKTGTLLRKHGVTYQALPWGDCDPKVYGMLMDLGVQSFATDQPVKTLRAVEEYYRRPR